jgi:hypothetical protein
MGEMDEPVEMGAQVKQSDEKILQDRTSDS